MPFCFIDAEKKIAPVTLETAGISTSVISVSQNIVYWDISVNLGTCTKSNGAGPI